MIRAKSTRKIFIAMFTLALTVSFVCPVYAVSVENTIANARDYNSNLISNFYDKAKESSLGIVGSYFEEASGITPKDDIFWVITTDPNAADNYAPENALALKAFCARKQVENDNMMVDWSKDISSDMFGLSGALGRQQGAPQGYLYSRKQGDSEANFDFSTYRFGLPQFMIMEAMGEYAMTFQDDSVTADLKNMYNAVWNTYRGNYSWGGNNPTGPAEMLIWSSCLVKGGGGLTSSFATGTDPKGHIWQYPLTTNSFWAAIGFARLGLASRDTTADTDAFFTTATDSQSFGDNCSAIADASMLYPELLCFNPEYGLYAEDWQDISEVFKLSTQALAILACSRLYQATKKQFYLERADGLIASIAKYFFVGSAGAGAMEVDLSIPGIADRSDVIDGYSNSFLAMALGDLFRVTNDYKYARLCQDIVTFFNTHMWQSGATIKGYCEYLNSSTMQWMVYPGYSSNNTKLISTNSMLLFANEMVIQSNKSFWDLYSFWIIIGAIVAVAVIIVIILVNRRGAVGTKLSKTVRGLITEA